METKSRKPVDEGHPVISAAISVLLRVGGPMKLTRLFRTANEEGLLPVSAGNTIRGRMSQHVQHAHRDGKDPAVVRLPKRRGWMLLDGALRKLRLTREWMQDVRAPGGLAALVNDLDGQATLARVMRERGLDEASITWLLETLPFDPALRARLERAANASERRQVLDEAG